MKRRALAIVVLLVIASFIFWKITPTTFNENESDLTNQNTPNSTSQNQDDKGQRAKNAQTKGLTAFIGTVSNQEGQRLKATVHLTSVGVNNYHHEEIPTDANGSFHIPIEKPGEYGLYASAPGYPLDPNEALSVTIKKDQIIPINIKLAKHPSFTFSLREAKTNRTVGGGVMKTSNLPSFIAIPQDGRLLLTIPKYPTLYSFLVPGYAYKSTKLHPAKVTPNQTIPVLMEKSGILHGTIVDEEGQAIAGASASFHSGGVHHTVYSNDEGAYYLDHLRRGAPARISFGKEGYETSVTNISSVVGKQKMDIVLKLAEPVPLSRITGFVTNPEDQPIANAQITIWQQKGYSDGNGRFDMIVPKMDHGRRHELVATRQGYGLKALEFVSGSVEAPTSVHVVLTPVEPIMGYVLDSEGQPLEKVAINLYATKRLGAPSFLKTSGLSDEDGFFQVDNPPQKGLVRFERIGYGTRAIELPLKYNEPQEIIMEAMLSLKGRVIDAETGNAVKGIMVSTNQQSRSLTLTNAKTERRPGEFTIGNMGRETRYDVAISAPGYERKIFKAIKADSKQQIFELERAEGMIHGRVLDSEGRAFPRSQITLLGTSSDVISISYIHLQNIAWRKTLIIDQEVLTDQQGYFHIKELPTKVNYKIFLTGDQVAHREVKVDEAHVKSDAEELTIIADPPGTIFGTVEAKLWPNATAVSIFCGLPKFHNELDLTGDGQFKFGHLPPGRYFVELLDKNQEKLQEKIVQLESGQSLEVHFDKADRHLLQGTLIGAHGPIAFAPVYLKLGLGDRETQTDKKGIFQFKDVPTGTIHLNAIKQALPPDVKLPGFQTLESFFGWHHSKQTFQLQEDQTNLILNHRPAGNLSGQLAQVPPNRVIKLQDLNAYAAVDDQGFFNFVEVPPGTYRIWQTGHKVTPLSDYFDMPAQDLDLGYIEPPSGGQAILRFNGDYPPIVSVEVTLKNTEETLLQKNLPGDREAILELPAEPVELSLSVSRVYDISPSTTTLHLQTDGQINLDFDIKQTTFVEILDNNYRRIDVTLFSNMDTGKVYQVSERLTEIEGVTFKREFMQITARGLPPGKWLVQQYYSDDTEKSVEFTLEQGEERRALIP